MPHICAALKFADAADVPVVIPLAVGVWHLWPEDEPIKGLLVARSKGGYKKMGGIVRYDIINIYLYNYISVLYIFIFICIVSIGG